MREANNSGWPFEEVPNPDFDMDEIFGGKKSPEKDPFEDGVAEGVKQSAEQAPNDLIPASELATVPASVEQKPAIKNRRTTIQMFLCRMEKSWEILLVGGKYGQEC